jgi:DHA3 family macrolide efflux protein-like MFS transporter
MMVHYAVQWHITLTSQSGVAMMLLSISSAAPMFLVSPFAGVWADRYSKKMLINLADASIAVVTLMMAVLFSLGFENIVLLLLCTAIRGFGHGVQVPAVNSLLPEIVPAENLTRINGINGSIQSSAMFASPVAGGALIAFLPIQAVLYIDVITAVIGISLLLFFVKTPVKEKTTEQKTAWLEMAEGLGYIKNHAFVKKFMIVNVLFYLLVTPAALLPPLQTVRDFGEEKWRLVAIELAFLSGMTLGGALIGIWGGFKNKSYTMAMGMALSGLGIASLGMLDNFTFYLACLGFTGFAWPAFSAPMMAVLQVKVDAEYMGRVFSVIAMLASIMMPVGMLVWGPLADKVPIDWLMLVSGVGIFATGTLFISNKTLREAGGS